MRYYLENQQQGKCNKISLFMGLHLFFLPNIPGAAFIAPTTCIPDSRILNTLNRTTGLFKGGISLWPITFMRPYKKRTVSVAFLYLLPHNFKRLQMISNELK